MTWLKAFWMQGWGYFVQMLSHKAGVPFATNRSPIHLPIMFCLRSDSRETIVNSETWRRLWVVADCSLVLDRVHNAAINNTCRTERQMADSLLGEGTLQQAGGLLKPEIPNCGSITISRIYAGELTSFSL